MADHQVFSYYQNYLQAGIAELQNYLLSDDLFRPMGLSGYPNLTLGGLLYFQRCASALAATDFQRNTFQKISTDLDVSRTRWRVAWEQKAARGFQSRLRQWGQVLNEIRSEPEKNAPYYRYEVRTRAMLTLLRPESGDLAPADREQYESQNLLLRALLQPSAFIWEPDLEPAFPQTEFWYLWGLPKQPQG